MRHDFARSAFAAERRMVMNVRARAVADWAAGVDHTESFKGSAMVRAVYRAEWQEMEKRYAAAQAGWQYQEAA